MATPIESFFVALGFDIDSKDLDKFSEKIGSAKKTVLDVGKVLGVAALAVGAFITKIGTSVDDLGDFAEAEQVGVQALSELGHAAQLNGSSLDAVKASVSGLNRTIGEAVLGIGRGAQTFQKLNLSAKNADGSVKNFDQVLAEVADRMQGLSRQEAIAMAEKLGIDRTLIPLLLKGRDAIEEYRAEARELGVITEEDAQTAGLFTDAFDRTRFVVGAVARGIAVNLMPAMTNMLDAMRKWLLVNREVVKSAITKFVQVFTALLGTLWDWVVRVADALAGLVRWLTTTNSGLLALIASVSLLVKFAAFRTFALMASGLQLFAGALTIANAAALVTIVIIGGLILGIGLLIDDFVNWQEGNESVFGDLAQQFPWLLDILNTVQSVVGTVTAFFLAQWGTLKAPIFALGGALGGLISVVFDLLWPVIRTVFTGWALLLAEIIPVIAAVVVWVAETLVSAIATVINIAGFLAETFTFIFQSVRIGFEVVTGLFEAMRQKVVGFIDSVLGAISKVGELLGLTGKAGDIRLAVSGAGAAAQSSANNSVNATGGVIGAAGSNTNSVSTVTQTTQITGTTIQVSSPDPAKAGEAVRKELETMNRQAIRNGQTAVGL